MSNKRSIFEEVDVDQKPALVTGALTAPNAGRGAVFVCGSWCSSRLLW